MAATSRPQATPASLREPPAKIEIGARSVHLARYPNLQDRRVRACP